MAFSRRAVIPWLTLLPAVLASTIAVWGLLSARRESFDLGFFTDPYFVSTLTFSLKQAALSCVLALLLALPVARALTFMPQLLGRRWFMTLTALAFVMPSFVLITGLMILLGANGWLNFGDPRPWSLFGLQGILLAHVYLNMPLAVRVLYQALQSVPQDSWRLSQQHRLTGWQRWSHIEWPAIKPHVGLLAAFIFVLCFNSFAVVLTLGGGPKSTTLELAIYQALKYDFNLSEALLLSVVQAVIAGSVLLAAGYSGKSSLFRIAVQHRPTGLAVSAANALGHRLVYAVAWVFLLLPIVAVMIKALSHGTQLQGIPLLAATGQSLLIAVSAALVAVPLGWLMLWPARHFQGTHARIALWAEWLALHHMVIPTLVIGVGWFAFWVSRIDINRASIPLLVMLNALVLVPFVVLQLKPLLVLWDQQHRRLLGNWRPNLWHRFFIEWTFIVPTLKPLFALALVLALGDVPLFALFGQSDQPTLTWYIYRLAGSYRLDQAAQAALMLLLLSSLLIYWMEPRHANRR